MRWSLLFTAGVCLAANDYTFVLDGPTRRVENAKRAAVRYSPCSTFKIPNSLIFLETQTATDPAFGLSYDPARDGDQHGVWALDHDLRSALRASAVWYYREMARRVGAEKMREWLARLEYGNQSMEPALDRFWLSGGLKISANEQVAFLRRVFGGGYKSATALKQMMLLESTREYKWYGKTGSCSPAKDEWVLWHVGFVERGGKVYRYALNLSDTTFAKAAERRIQLVREKLAGLIAPAPVPAAEQMTAKVEELIEGFPGTISLYGKNLDTGATFGVRPDERVRTASTIKLAILYAVFNAVSAGKARWDEPLTMRKQDKVSGSGVIRELEDGTKLTVRDLVHMMTVVSDNTATNMLIERFTADFVNDEMRKLGLKDTLSMRKVLGGAPSREGQMAEFQKYGLGVSTPHEMVTLLEKMTPEMLAILQRQQYKDSIGRRQRDEEVASKSGSLDRLRSDVGIVNSAGGRIAMALTVDDMKRTDYSPDNAGNIVLADIADAMVEGLGAPVKYLGEMERVVTLDATMDHVQGIHVEGDRLWVSWVDRKAKTGHLGEFNAVTGKLVRSVAVHSGDRYHPGGIAGDGASIWVPVAEYRANSSAVIQRRNKDTLALESEFAVEDHIGCVAVNGGTVYGGNWDARVVYTWDRSGRPVGRTLNPHRTRYQDMKFVDGALVGSGLRGGEGAIDKLDPATLQLRERTRVGKSNRGVVLTHEGMALEGGKVYLLPEDGPSRLFVYR